MTARTIVLIALLPLLGCSAQEAAQQRLIASMQTGLADVAKAQDERQQLIDDLYASRRRVLDGAFDQDVLQRPALDANWVIEHRKAYSLALEAMCRQQQSSALANQRMQENLLTIEDNLKKLTWLSELRENWTKPLGFPGSPPASGGTNVPGANLVTTPSTVQR